MPRDEKGFFAVRGRRRGFGRRGIHRRRRRRPAAVQVPEVQIGSSARLKLAGSWWGANQFYGYSHFNRTLDAIMKEWYTPEQVCELLRHATEYGMNAFQALGSGALLFRLRALRSRGRQNAATSCRPTRIPLWS